MLDLVQTCTRDASRDTNGVTPQCKTASYPPGPLSVSLWTWNMNGMSAALFLCTCLFLSDTVWLLLLHPSFAVLIWCGFWYMHQPFPIWTTRGTNLYSEKRTKMKTARNEQLQSDSDSARSVTCFIRGDLYTTNLSMVPDWLERSQNYLSNEYSNTQNGVCMWPGPPIWVGLLLDSELDSNSNSTRKRNWLTHEVDSNSDSGTTNWSTKAAKATNAGVTNCDTNSKL